MIGFAVINQTIVVKMEYQRVTLSRSPNLEEIIIIFLIEFDPIKQ